MRCCCSFMILPHQEFDALFLNNKQIVHVFHLFTLRERCIFVNKKWNMGKEIIHIALERLRKITGLEANWIENGPLDGMLDIKVNGQQYTYDVEVKGELRNHQLQNIEEQFNQNIDFMLFARHIFPKIKEELRKMEIPYLEAINLTQRELAEHTKVGLGTIPLVIEGLKETGYLIPLNNKTHIWENRKGLLERWITAYATELRPKLEKERYTLKGDWQEIRFDPQKTVWGGEPAADILTNYLRPEKFILYTKENRMDLIKKYKLMPDKNGEIEVLDMFWGQADEKTAPPLLVYADLKLEGGKRNNETAEKIYHAYIEPNL